MSNHGCVDFATLPEFDLGYAFDGFAVVCGQNLSDRIGRAVFRHGI